MPPIKPFNAPAEVLGYEIAQEQASALGRLGRALESALVALQAFDDAHPCTGTEAEAEAPSDQRQARRALVSAAGHALWMFMVQREACGLRETRGLMRDYNVPAEVQKCMGIFPPRQSGPG